MVRYKSILLTSLAKSTFSQVEDKGKDYIFWKEILDHANNDGALCKDDAKIPGTPQTH
jgi:hypothetical protein